MKGFGIEKLMRNTGTQMHGNTLHIMLLATVILKSPCRKDFFKMNISIRELNLSNRIQISIKLAHIFVYAFSNT